MLSCRKATRRTHAACICEAGILLATAFAGSDAPTPDPVSSPDTPAITPQLSFAVTIPNLMSYQGKLTDTLGVPVPDGNYPTRFRLYSVPSGGTHYWQETQSVSTEDGLFAVLLGSVTPIPARLSPGTCTWA
ncbi:MAG: hypothetical protein JSU73_04415 [candidate division WOR-3 bacterium]|nr:MAG: hypothetical protein JSU73_04415 [candidate division WOR-3 bacterium]